MIKSLSTRAKICGRSANCYGGHSAVEQSSYISRKKMYCDYDGQTYYPKYSEDLVYSEVMLPHNAPKEYMDPSALWNSVEMNEKAVDAQLARTYRVELPNEWSYELAVEVMRDYVKRNFVDEGMCAQFAIHDSENKLTGQRNLHCHILLTMRGIDEQGRWMPKQKKVYLKDEKGERIPLIDKKTGQQKVDKRNRKQWKCATVPTNDWSSRENAKRWREDLADTINAVNQKIGMTDNYWEHRSFKDQGLDIVPQIHLGEKASALERTGIRTTKGDANREIMAYNAIFLKAKAAYVQAKEVLDYIRMLPVNTVKLIKNEIVDMIQEVARRNNDRLKFPILGTKYLRLISNRSALQDKTYMERFVGYIGVTTFAEMQAFKKEYEEKYNALYSERLTAKKRITYLEGLLEAYKDYEPYIKFHKKQWELRGFAKKMYERKHVSELAYYDSYRSQIKSMITEPDKKIIPKSWQQELDTLRSTYEKSQKPFADAISKLASIEVLEFNKGELARMLENEKHQKDRNNTRRRVNNQSL